MSGQRFAARLADAFSNGAVGWRPGGPMDCLGPYAKVQNCPIAGTTVRRTCYATDYANTMFSVPAATRIAGKHVGGFFTVEDGGITFNPRREFLDRIPESFKETA